VEIGVYTKNLKALYTLTQISIKLYESASFKAISYVVKIMLLITTLIYTAIVFCVIIAAYCVAKL